VYANTFLSFRLNYRSGLFHKGISESGTAIKIWTLSKFPKEQSKKFASKLGCDAESTQEMVDCLKKLDGPSLVKPHIDTMVIRKKYMAHVYKAYCKTAVLIKKHVTFLW